MKTYDIYKESYNIWLGNIPEHWTISSLKHFVEIISGYAFKSEDYSNDQGVPIIRIGDISNSVDVYNAKKAKPKNLEELDRFIIKRGDLLLAMTGATIGKNCMYETNEISYVNQRVGLLRGKNSLTQYYLKYFIDTPLFREFISLTCSGSAQENISTSQVGGLQFPLPSIEEQTKIAQYLDTQTAIIDLLIQQKEKLIELLKEKRQAVINEAVTKGLDPNAKMKESGDDWIGCIPENWITSKIKFAANIQGRVGYKGYTKEDIVSEGEGALTLGAKHIDKENNLDLKSPEYIKWEKYDESPEIMVKLDDVIFTQRGSLGKVCHINYDIGKATINPSMVILSSKNVYPRFLYYWLCGIRIQDEVKILQSNTAVPMISQYQLSNFPILLPPVNEQIEIANAIDSKLSAFRVLISKVNNQIEGLKEYRQSIISEAVTGKIDVREWQPNK
jgi:type I restriction enzyme S subunit